MSRKEFKYWSILYVERDMEDCDLVRDALNELDPRVQLQCVLATSAINLAANESNFSPEIVIIGFDSPC